VKLDDHAQCCRIAGDDIYYGKTHATVSAMDVTDAACYTAKAARLGADVELETLTVMDHALDAAGGHSNYNERRWQLLQILELS